MSMQATGAASFPADISTAIRDPRNAPNFYKVRTGAAAHRAHHLAQDNLYRSLRLGRLGRGNELRDRLNGLYTAQAAAARDERRMSVKPDQSVKLQIEIDAIKKEMNELSNLPVIELVTPLADAGASNNNPELFADVDPEAYKTDATVDEAKREFLKARRRREGIEDANDSTANAIADWKRQYESLKAKGAPDVAMILAGGALLNSGKFALRKTEPNVVFQPTYVVENIGEAVANFPIFDALAFMCFCDVDGKIFKAVADVIAANNNESTSIAIEDKPALLKEARAAELAAMRRLEYACVRDEKIGRIVRRMDETPWEVLLWVERAPAKPKLVASDDPKPVKRRMIRPGDPLPGDEVAKPSPDLTKPVKRKMIHPGDPVPGDDEMDFG